MNRLQRVIKKLTLLLAMFSLSYGVVSAQFPCDIQSDCTAPWNYDNRLYLTDLCPPCDYTMEVFWRVCPGPPCTVEFTLGIGRTVQFPGDPNDCGDCPLDELLSDAITKILERFASDTGCGDPHFEINMHMASCWRYLDHGPAGDTGGHAIDYCASPCCRYKYFVDNGSVTLVDVQIPDSNCEGDCVPVCDPMGFVPPEKKGTFENYDTGFEIYPNPANNNIQLRIDNAISGKYELTVYDSQGRFKQRQWANIESGTLIFKIPLEHLGNGSYIFVLVLNSKVYKSGKFIVQ